jgi:hypothetical protein
LIDSLVLFMLLLILIDLFSFIITIITNSFIHSFIMMDASRLCAVCLLL